MPAVALGGLAGILVFALDRPTHPGSRDSVTAGDGMSGDQNATGDTLANGASDGFIDTTVPVKPAWSAPTTAVSVDNVGASSAGGSTSGTAPATTAPVATLTAPTPTNSDVCRSYRGPTAWNDYGPVQVAASVAHSGKICSVSVIQSPSGGRSSTINANAVPKLVSQAMKAQSANVAGVSGATYTSAGFRQSLQAILNAAKR